MDIHKNYSFNYKDIILEEIALDGLEGSTLSMLWRHLEKRISTQLTQKMKIRYWDFISQCKSIKLYSLDQPLPQRELLNRFLIVDETSGNLLDPPEYVDGRYEFSPVEQDHGSCSNFDKRKAITKLDIQRRTYEDVVSEYGDRLVLVASLEERWRALAPQAPFSCLSQLTPVHYCILEVIGRSRENGQMTVGKTNLTKIVKDPKLLFYNRNQLQKLDLIRVIYVTQVIDGRNVKSLLLRLKKFHRPSILSMPQVGKLHNIVQYLLKQPNYSEKNNMMIKKGFYTTWECKRYQKTNNVFHFFDINLDPKKKGNEEVPKALLRKYVSLTTCSDESSQSEDECSEVSLTTQYKVGVNLLRQAYERFLDAGLKGLTQIELSRLLGIEFYTGRTICRLFKQKKILREYFEDKGRQRTARYVAVAATQEMDLKYESEKKKFFDYCQNAKKRTASKDIPDNSDDVDSGIPKKKTKLDSNNEESDNCDPEINEVKAQKGSVSTSLVNCKKPPTLRQLKFANGILKIIQERKYVIGYQCLSTLVSKEINESPMDTKSLRMFTHKLVNDGQLKVIEITLPDKKQNFLIFSPDLKRNDPIIKAKCKEILVKNNNAKMRTAKKNYHKANHSKTTSQYAYPKYMKIQKLHELIIEYVYFSNIKREGSKFSPGFASITNIIPQMTVALALGNISNISSTELGNLKIGDNLLDVKLTDSPSKLCYQLTQSKSLQASLKLGIKALAVLGLVQLIDTSGTHFENDNYYAYMFYVNRHAKLLDTTGTWPRSDVKEEDIEKSYHFTNMVDVKKFWDDVYNISTNTIIKIQNRKSQLTPSLRQIDEVMLFDKGLRAGNGLGPCGYDSALYMEVSRLWTTVYARPTKIKAKPTKKTKTMKTKADKILKKDVLPKKSKLPIGDKNALVSRNNPQTKKQDRPDIKWAKWEDDIIVMCRAALTIMSPVTQPGGLKIRNTVAKDVVSIFDRKKTIKACRKREMTLESRTSYTHERDSLINELRRHRNLIHKYEGILGKIRVRYSTNMTKYLNEARLQMLGLMWIMIQFKRSVNYTQKSPCIAVNLADFNKNYTLSPATANKNLNLYKTSLDSGSQLAMIKEGIILTLTLSVGSVLTLDQSAKIYKTFKVYPEEILRTGLEQLRKSAAIASREKNFNSQIGKNNVENIVQSHFKLSAIYLRKWKDKIKSDFLDGVSNTLYTEIPQNGIKGSAPLNCVLLEMQACNVLDITSTTLPLVMRCTGSLIHDDQLNPFDPENKYKLKSGTLGWKSKRNMRQFVELYQRTEFQKPQTLSCNIIEINEDSCEMENDSEVISFLMEQGKNGATLRELQTLCKNKEQLDKLIVKLETDDLVKLIGYYENRIVLTKNAKPWALDIEGKNIIPKPWLNLEGEVRHKIFFMWANVIVSKIFEYPGCSIAYLSDQIEYLSIRSIQDICVFLENCECVKLNTMETIPVDLFSDDELVMPELNPFNQFDSPSNIIVFPMVNMLTKYAYIRHILLQS